MVSLHQEGDKNVYLGLGLHIVRLITDFHRGSVKGQNLPDGEGVVFSMVLPQHLEPEEDSTGSATDQ